MSQTIVSDLPGVIRAFGNTANWAKFFLLATQAKSTLILLKNTLLRNPS